MAKVFSAWTMLTSTGYFCSISRTHRLAPPTRCLPKRVTSGDPRSHGIPIGYSKQLAVPPLFIIRVFRADYGKSYSFIAIGSFFDDIGETL